MSDYVDAEGQEFWQHPVYENVWFNIDGQAFTSMKFIKVGQPWLDMGIPYAQMRSTIDRDGYDTFTTAVGGNRKRLRAARAFYEAYHNIIIERDMEVDHIDRNRSNNHISNLRLVTRLQNRKNMATSDRNKQHSPYKSVYQFHGKRACKNGRNFQAQIIVDNKYIYLGRYFTAEEAQAAYDEASKKYHGEYGVTNAELQGINCIDRKAK